MPDHTGKRAKNPPALKPGNRNHDTELRKLRDRADIVVQSVRRTVEVTQCIMAMTQEHVESWSSFKAGHGNHERLLKDRFRATEPEKPTRTDLPW